MTFVLDLKWKDRTQAAEFSSELRTVGFHFHNFPTSSMNYNHTITVTYFCSLVIHKPNLKKNSDIWSLNIPFFMLSLHSINCGIIFALISQWSPTCLFPIWHLSILEDFANNLLLPKTIFWGCVSCQRTVLLILVHARIQLSQNHFFKGIFIVLIYYVLGAIVKSHLLNSLLEHLFFSTLKDVSFYRCIALFHLLQIGGIEQSQVTGCFCSVPQVCNIALIDQILSGPMKFQDYFTLFIGKISPKC